MRFYLALCVLATLFTLGGAVFAQDVSSDPVWKALVEGDKAIESGTLTFTQNGVPAPTLRSRVYSYAPNGRFRDVIVGLTPKAAPFTMGFDGQETWMNAPLGTNLYTKKQSRDWGQDAGFGYSSVVPRASFPMGRGLSFLQHPRIERKNGQINVTGEWIAVLPFGRRVMVAGKRTTRMEEQKQTLPVVAVVDPKANFLARSIAVMQSDGAPLLFWTTSGSLAGDRIAANSVSHVKNRQGAAMSSFTFASAKFGPLPPSTFAPKIHGVNVYDFRMNEARPTFYFGGVPPGLSRSQLLADTRDDVAKQNAMRTRSDWMTRWAIGGGVVLGLALVCGVVAGFAALWNRRQTRARGVTPTRSLWGSRFFFVAALCAWGFVLAAFAFFKGWTPASLASGRADVVAEQTRIAANAAFGTISPGDKRLKGAFAATDLVAARAKVMKPGAFVGTVSNVRQTKRDELALDFAPDRSMATRAVVSPSALGRFPNLRNLIGHKVYVSGSIMPHENRAEIVLHAPSQLLLVQ